MLVSLILRSYEINNLAVVGVTVAEFSGFHDLFNKSRELTPQEDRSVGETYSDDSKLYKPSDPLREPGTAPSWSESLPGVKTGTVPSLTSPYRRVAELQELVTEAAEQTAAACEYEEATYTSFGLCHCPAEGERPLRFANNTSIETSTLQHPPVVQIPASDLALQAGKPIEDYIDSSGSLPKRVAVEAYGHLLSEAMRRGLTEAAQESDDISQVKYKDETGPIEDSYQDIGRVRTEIGKRIPEEAPLGGPHDKVTETFVDCFKSENESIFRILNPQNREDDDLDDTANDI